MSTSRTVAFTASKAARTAEGIVRGYLVHETAGAAAQVEIYDNASAASGTLIGAATLTANGAVDVDIAGGLWVTNGVYVSVVSGAVAGHVRVG